MGTLGAGILRLLNATLRWRYAFVGDGSRTLFDNEAIILAFWHNRQLVMPWIYLYNRGVPRRSMNVLISGHADGRIIATAIEKLGLKVVTGSSSQGGREALLTLTRTLRNGGHIAITPDGPRGPIYKAKAGAVKLGQRTGAKIVPVAYGAERAWQFKSWDKMILPKPFSRSVFVIGAPISIPESCSDQQFEECMSQVEKQLNAVTTIADDYRY